ncbi:molybdate transport system substrate-binding protein [Mesobacillus persicus]|uniref:Molybdate transport system substrate-binding protein n=1 Tax=Mesobacillus persicus TaxID=930146 RepID=A0A1H8HP35_9BACI|nr:molybdate ABC transporter substrate-binding protein [Mesobacillus persicus]SEN57676.1 molybdate transport system substrate-binding protein [Mesobacillus persicus]
MNKLLSIFSFFLFLALSGCSPQTQNNEQIEITISAAASLTEVLSELEVLYEEEKNHDINLLFNFGGSGSLQQQILQGAPVDLYFSAAEDKYNQLLERGLIDADYSSDFISNELVLITPTGTSNEMRDFSDLVSDEISRIAIGTPETVPAGQYTKQAMENMGIWDKLSGKIIPTKDVRQVLSYVETNNVDAGIVYKTDALVSKKVKMVTTIDTSLHNPIVYPVGVLSTSTQKDEAINFFNYLQTESAIEIFKKFGFELVR